MRKKALLAVTGLFISIAILASGHLALKNAHAAGDPPELAAWTRNTTGLTGYKGIAADVQQVRYSDNSVYVNSTGIPDYSIGPWPGNPNTASNQNFVFKIPRHPSQNTGAKTSTPLGVIGVWKNGVGMFNALDAMSYQNQNIWHQNAVKVEAPSFDSCLGHPQQSGVYHHHQNARCLYTTNAAQHSPLLGYAYDGFPVYGPYGYANADGSGGIKRVASSYQARNITQRHSLADGTVLNLSQYGPDVSGTFPIGYYAEDFEFVTGIGDLDQYNGRFAVTPEYPNGTYAYYVTINADASSAYPYIIGSQYYGVVATENITAGGHVSVTEPVNTYSPSVITPTAINGHVATGSSASISGVVVQLSGPATGKTISDSQGNYSFTNLTTGGSYTVSPSRANYTFSPPSQTLTLTGTNTSATFTAIAGPETQNPLDTAEYFVRQQYLDFLSREPDNAGFNYWSDSINVCGSDAGCISSRRITASAAFYIESEFQDSGSYVYLLYRGSLGRQPGFAEFNSDRGQVVGGATLDASKQALATAWVERVEFLQLYPATLSNTDFVNKLFDTAGLTPYSSERQQEITAMAAGSSRAAVLQDLVAISGLKKREYNPAFVLMQYFGYLRRDPDLAGYQFWLDVLNNRDANNYQGMVCSFITSSEYQLRFGNVISRSNAECKN